MGKHAGWSRTNHSNSRGSSSSSNALLTSQHEGEIEVTHVGKHEDTVDFVGKQSRVTSTSTVQLMGETEESNCVGKHGCCTSTSVRPSCAIVLSKVRNDLHLNAESMAEMPQTTELLRRILLGSNIDWQMTPDIVNDILKKATASLGHDIIYDTTTLENMILERFSKRAWCENDKLLNEGTNLHTIITNASQHLRFNGKPEQQLLEYLKGIPNRRRVVNIGGVGQRVCKNSNFKPNGGLESKVLHG